MVSPAQMFRRLRALFSGRRVDSEMTEEMRFHLAMESEAGEKAGLSADEARRQARLAFGSEQRYREEGSYLERVYKWMDRVGLKSIIERVVDDVEERAALYARFMQAQATSQDDPWAERAAGAEASEFQGRFAGPVNSPSQSLQRINPIFH